MTDFKKIEENFKTAQQWVHALQDRVSTSFPKFLLAFSLIGLVIVGGQYVYLGYLLKKQDEQAQTQIRNVNLLGERLEYQTAIGAVTSCLESRNDSSELHNWYCSQAVEQYRDASENWPQTRVGEVVDRRAYLGMREDLKGYVRGLELGRLTNAHPSGAQATLEFLLSKTIIAAWIFFIFVVLTGSYLFLWVVPRRRRDLSSV